MENWKKIKGFENYSVSDLGRVRNDKTGRIMKTPCRKNGYPRVHLYDDMKGSCKTVHRLVAETFIPNPENLPQVNHKDGNKMNNSVINLEWVSFLENMRHASENGLLKSPKGEINSQSKLTKIEVLEIRRLRKEGWKQGELARKFNVVQGQISNIVNKKSWVDVQT